MKHKEIFIIITLVNIELSLNLSLHSDSEIDLHKEPDSFSFVRNPGIQEEITTSDPSGTRGYNTITDYGITSQIEAERDF